MTLTVKELIKQNNEKRKLLLPENENYYENLLVYIRSNLFRKERATEEILLEMLDHLLEAQKEGKTAEQVFGKSPQQLAEEIIESLPKESMKEVLEFVFENVLTLFGWFLVAWGFLPLISKEEQSIHIGTAAITALCVAGSLFLIVYFVFVMLKKNAFHHTKKGSVLWSLGILIGSIWAIVLFINISLEPFGPIVQINEYTGFGLGCFFLLAAYILKKSREAK